MVSPPDKDDLTPDTKRYSAVTFDTWLDPTNPGFYDKVAEFDNLADLPQISISQGEKLVIYDSTGYTVESWDGPAQPTAPPTAASP